MELVKVRLAFSTGEPYREILNPFGSGGPEPEIRVKPDGGDIKYLELSIDLRGFTGDFYTRRIVSAWVYPCEDNWGLERWRLLLHSIDVHNDLDSW